MRGRHVLLAETVSLVKRILERAGPVYFVLDQDNGPVHQKYASIGTLNHFEPLGSSVTR